MIHDLPPILLRLQRRSLLVGVVSLAICVIGIFLSGISQVLLAYLLAFVLWTGLSLGCLALLMTQHLTGGAWGLVTRRPLESGARLIPLMAICSLPVLLGLRHLYVWTSAPNELSDFQHWYLTPSFFIARTILYFAIWSLLAFFLGRWSAQEDLSTDPRFSIHSAQLSGIGLVLYGVTITLAVTDWVMSLTPEWNSTIFGFIFIAGEGLFTLAAMILVLALLRGSPGMLGVVGRARFQEIGNLLLAFILLWAYVSFSQFLLIWAGNLREETPFYVYRMQHGFQYVAILLILGGFFVPFLFLLSSGLKRSVRAISILAGFIILMRLVDLYWIIIPSYYQGRHLDSSAWHFSYLYILAPLGLGGLWTAAYIRELGRLPLIPIHDPRLSQLGGEHG